MAGPDYRRTLAKKSLHMYGQLDQVCLWIPSDRSVFKSGTHRLGTENHWTWRQRRINTSSSANNEEVAKSGRGGIIRPKVRAGGFLRERPPVYPGDNGKAVCRIPSWGCAAAAATLSTNQIRMDWIRWSDKNSALELEWMRQGIRQKLPEEDWCSRGNKRKNLIRGLGI